MDIIYKIISFFPMLPLPGAAYFLVRALFEERTQKKILYVASGSTLLVLFVSTVVLILYIKAILDEGRAKHKRLVKKDISVQRNTYTATEKDNIQSDTTTEYKESIRGCEDDYERLEEENPLLSTPTEGGGDNIRIPEKYAEYSNPPAYAGSGRETVQNGVEPERSSVVIVNTNIIQNSAAPAILKVSSDSSSVYLLDQDFAVWINDRNMRSTYSKRQLDKYGLPALYQVLDLNGLPIADGKYKYLMTQEPCRVEKRQDSSFCVARKGKVFFQKC